MATIGQPSQEALPIQKLHTPLLPAISRVNRATVVHSLLVYIPILLLLLATPLRGNPDVTFLLDTGYRVLNGQLPYVDFFEVNLPLIFYLSALPVWISQWSGIGVILVTHLLVFVLTIASAWTVDQLLAHAQRQQMFLFLSRHHIPLLYGLGTVIAMLFGFGQREHLLALAAIPWLLLRCLRLSHGAIPRPMALVLGGITALAFTLKPHYVFIFLVIELVVLARGRNWRLFVTPEGFGVVIAAAGYVVYALLFPQVIRAYIEAILPVTIAGYDVLGNANPVALLLQDPMMCLLLILAVGSFALSIRQGSHAALLQSLSLALLAALAGFAVQGKGWFYHQIPALWLGLVLVYALSKWHLQLAFLQPFHVGLLYVRRMFSLLVLLLITVFFIWAGWYWLSLPYGQGKLDVIQVIQAYAADEDQVIVLDAMLFEIYPTLIQAGHWQALRRYQTAASIGLGYYGLSPADIDSPAHVPPAHVQEFLDETVRSLSLADTHLVLIRDEDTSFRNYSGNIYRYLMARPAFRAVLTEQYTYLETVDGFRVYLRNEQ